jgi:hypothetical protein
MKLILPALLLHRQEYRNHAALYNTITNNALVLVVVVFSIQ